MITGARRAARALAACAALLAAGTAAGAEWGLEQLMQELAQVKTTRARFIERKHTELTNAPLESSGTLVYTAPDRLEKHTLKPRQESLLLEKDRLVLENKARNQRRTFVLQEHPEIGAFVESMRSTLAGDLATLKRYYQVGLEGDERQWRLTLKPSDARMQKVISEIRIGGSRVWIDTIEILETLGDRSLMTISRDER